MMKNLSLLLTQKRNTHIRFQKIIHLEKKTTISLPQKGRIRSTSRQLFIFTWKRKNTLSFNIEI